MFYMAEESFLLVSLKEGKSKQLAQVISNETSRKILDLLTKKSYTETEIAKGLQLPISTVHYNIQHLLDTGLVVSEEFHYSEKGKEVNHYKLSNKFIIIAPTISESVKEKLKRILPIGMIAIVAAGFIQLLSKIKAPVIAQEPLMRAAPAVAEEAIKEAAQEAVTEAAKEAVIETVPAVAEEAAQEAAPAAAQVVQTAQPLLQNIALWFLFGAVFAILLIFIIDLVRKR